MADMYERKPQHLTGPGGDQEELRVGYIDNGDGTWSMATSPLTLPRGAATSAKQDTTNLKLDKMIGLPIPEHDYGSVNYATATQEIYTFKTGGSGGTTVGTLTLNYTDATKENISNWELT